MISRRYIYIFSLGLLLLTPASVFAAGLDSLREELSAADTTVAENANMQVTADSVVADSLSAKKFLSGVELSLDYGKMLTLWTSFESKYEAGINIRFLERLVLAGEVGYADLNPLKAYDNAVYYNVKGSFARFGLDYYTSYDPKNFYYAGLRYGMSTFEDKGAFLIDSEYWEDLEEEFGSSGITAGWVEIVLGTETYLHLFQSKETQKSASRFLLGWKFRLRILTDFQNREEPRIYSIPGYGRTFDKTVPAVNFYVKYRIGK